jgi:L-arabinonolactonase
MHIEAVPVERDLLGESPVWDHRIGALYWADQLGRKVRRYHPTTGELHEWSMPRELGCVALTSDVNTLLVAQPDAYELLSLESGASHTLVTIPQPRPGVRLNDGRCDRSGGLIGGSVTTDGGSAAGAIWRIAADGSTQVLRKDMVIVNAICCNPAGNILYYADSRGGLLYRRSYDPAGAGIAAEVELVDVRPFGGTPDGATVDAEGAIWMALIMPGKIMRFLADGTLDREIRMPAPHVSSLAFGGENFDTLYVTTVRETGMLISTNHSEAGKVFAITGLGVCGVPEGIFALNGRH